MTPSPTSSGPARPASPRPIPAVQGLELEALLTTSALGGLRDSRSYLTQLAHALEDLCHGWPTARFDVRLLWQAQRVRVQLLTTAPAEEVLSVLRLPEHRWRTLSRDEVSAALHPFAVADVLLLERAAGVPLHLEGAGEGVGERTGDVAQGGTLWSVRQPGHGPHDWPALLSALTRQDSGVLLSVRFGHATLSDLERNFAHSQVAQLAQSSARLDSLRPLGEQASRSALGWAVRLEQVCAAVTLTVAGEEALSALLIHALRRALAGQAALLEPILLDPEEGKAAVAALSSLQAVSSLYGVAPSGLERLTVLCRPLDLASLVPLPPAPERPLAGLPCQDFRLWPLTAPTPDGLRLGQAQAEGGHAALEARISPGALARHFYVVGKTGSGKTTLLRGLALDAMHQGRGLVVLDPHGDLHAELLERVPEHRRADLLVVDPLLEGGATLNPFAVSGDYARRMVAMEFGEIMQRLTEDEYGTAAGSFMGPIWHQELRMAVRWITSSPLQSGTVIDLYRFFTEKDYFERWTKWALADPELEAWWQNHLTQTNYQHQGSEGGPSVGAWMASKFQSVAYHPALRRFFGGESAPLKLDEALSSGKIVLINLARGQLGESASRFLGMVTVHLLFQAFLRRAALPRSQRPDTLLIGDEFQTYASTSFVGLLSEGRKFGVNLVLANQFLAQLPERLRGALLGNVGSLACFRVGFEDAALLEREFGEGGLSAGLGRLPNFHAHLRLHGVDHPFTLRV